MAVETVKVFNGNSLEVLREFPDNCIDAGVMDPPAFISFMGKAWDSDKSYAEFVEVISEVFRVIKPGGHVLVWAIPRTSWMTGSALNLVGFEVRDVIAHAFGTGFPKSMNIAKAIQKESGVEPIGERPPSLGMANNPQWNDLQRQLIMPDPEGLAAEWEGWGTALKPAREDWFLARKPISEKTVAKNVLKWGTGALNIDACRIGTNAGWSYPAGRGGDGCFGDAGGFAGNLEEPMQATKGRFPANLVLSHDEDCQLVGTTTVKSGKAHRNKSGGKNIHSEVEKPAMEDMSYADENGNETVERWACVSGCPIRTLDEQSGLSKAGTAVQRNRDGEVHNKVYGKRKCPAGADVSHADYGGASRFFYVAKPAKAEKEAGLKALPKKTASELTGRKEGSAGLVAKHTDGSDKANPYAGTSGAEPRANTHPTVKSVALMSYLCKLITPPNGIVLDPFMGSGSTGVGALAAGFRFIGIEREEEYFKIAEARLNHAQAQQ